MVMNGRADVILNVGDTAPLRSCGCFARAFGAYDPHGSPRPLGGGTISWGQPSMRSARRALETPGPASLVGTPEGKRTRM